MRAFQQLLAFAPRHIGHVHKVLNFPFTLLGGHLLTFLQFNFNLIWSLRHPRDFSIRQKLYRKPQTLECNFRFKQIQHAAKFFQTIKPDQKSQIPTVHNLNVKKNFTPRYLCLLLLNPALHQTLATHPIEVAYIPSIYL